MRYRKLRIAWSASCGIACVLLIALWVRSYRVIDIVHCEIPHFNLVEVAAFFGEVRLSTEEGHPHGQADWGSPSLLDERIAQSYREHPLNRLPNALGFGMTHPNVHGYKNTALFLPYWMCISVVSMLALSPWAMSIRYRFSLRTLLIATTLVAVVLGLIMWLRYDR